MKIRLGPAGNCISAEEKGTTGSLKRIVKLGLEAQEIEFVRNVYMSNKMAKEVGKVAKELKIELSVHAPYYINLSSSEKIKIKASKKRILDSLERGNLMGATVVVVHAGYYGKNKEKSSEMIFDACKDLTSIIKKKGWKTLLGLETTGKQGQWGTLDEIINLCRKLKYVIPCIDFAHLYARQGGQINYKEVFNKLKVLKLKKYHCHFSGIKYSLVRIGDGNERYHLQMKEAGPDFKELAKEILKRKLDITIISESPILEQDSLLMKKIFEKLGYKFFSV